MKNSLRGVVGACNFLMESGFGISGKGSRVMLPEHIKRAIDEYVPPLGDWLDLSRAYEMAELILEVKPQVVVEVGTFKGQSLITQAFALRENNDGGKIYA